MLDLPDSFYESLKTFEYALDAVITIDSKSRIIGWNKQAEICFGKSKQEALQKTITEFIIPSEYRKAHENGMKRFLATGEGPILNKRIEVKALNGDNHLFDAELSVVPARINDHLIFHGFIRDTSESKKSEQKLLLQHEILSILVKQNPSEFIHEILEKISYTQGFQFAAFWKYNKFFDELTLTGESFQDHPNLLKFADLSSEYTFRKGEGGPGMAWKNKVPFWLPEISKSENFVRKKIVQKYGFIGGVWIPIFSDDYFFGVLEFLNLKKIQMDENFKLITLGLGKLIAQGFERERVVRQLAREKSQTQYLSEISMKTSENFKDEALAETLQQLVNLSVPAIADWCSIRLQDNLHNEKKVFIAHISKEKKEIAIKIADSFIGHPEQGTARILRTGESIIQSVISEDFLAEAAENETQKKYFKALNFQSWIGAPIKTANEVYGAISFLSSDTPVRYFDQEDLKFLEEVGRRIALIIKQAFNQETLEKTRVSALKANEAKSIFLANMSHEIRTPLGAILGFTEVLQSDNHLTRNQSEWITKIKSNGDHLLSLINDILDLSKIENKNIKLDLRKTSSVEIFRSVSDTVLSLIGKKDIQFHCKFLSPVPEFIYSDSTKIKQVLMNLLGNSVKFTQIGNIEVEVNYIKQKERFQIFISDTGRGIKPKDFTKIFNPFEQGKHLYEDPMPGTGLGLPLSKAIAQRFKGDVILVKSKPNKKTKFEFTFKATPLPKSHFLRNISLDQEESPLSQENRCLNGKKILLVDDTKDNIIYISIFLKNAGAIVSTADNGARAIEMASKYTFDLILMDIQMPKIDGLEATQKIRKKGIGTPIIALTAHSLKEDIEKSLAAGCNLHLSKPVEKSTLISTVMDWI